MTLLRRVVLGTVFGLALGAGSVQAGGGGAPPPQAAVPCAPGYVRPDFAALERELVAARAQWALAGVRSYRYEFRQVAAPVLFPTVLVLVLDRTVREVTLVAGESGPVSPLARVTVEGRFDQIAQTLAAQRGQPCPVVEAEYAAEEGYPTRLYSGTGTANVADGWGEWTVTRFIRVVQTLPGG
ncbi:DUF6174 domain-containing protein [Deinococcus sp. MIMF12]|uniref:DUF6174 domain-containing protein n=1 Tax=Deinococcus rhizophilus TaxID=3049544 RepID=A0ABT7JHD9_9DEIO|nr:DUF6174 domain-containing protein [Deinococcus rhizophilus]MDL2344336.1 DUF6174 domain-containing protein [Deinococcus rhizophilus]